MLGLFGIILAGILALYSILEVYIFPEKVEVPSPKTSAKRFVKIILCLFTLIGSILAGFDWQDKEVDAANQKFYYDTLSRSYHNGLEQGRLVKDIDSISQLATRTLSNLHDTLGEVKKGAETIERVLDDVSQLSTKQVVVMNSMSGLLNSIADPLPNEVKFTFQMVAPVATYLYDGFLSTYHLSEDSKASVREYDNANLYSLLPGGYFIITVAKGKDSAFYMGGTMHYKDGPDYKDDRFETIIEPDHKLKLNFSSTLKLARKSRINLTLDDLADGKIFVRFNLSSMDLMSAEAYIGLFFPNPTFKRIGPTAILKYDMNIQGWVIKRFYVPREGHM